MVIKALSTLFLFCVISLRTLGCGWYDPEEAYYNLFMQEIIGDARYFPFLVTYSGAYYTRSEALPIPNENIESWQAHLGISYDQAYYLVFKAERQALRALLKGKENPDGGLAFINRSFLSEHRQALEYLAYAKYLEPYMTHRINQDNRWDESSYKPIDALPEAEIIETLSSRWKSTRNKSLKLRYGYQMVRFAHYTGAYKDALSYFNKYVESLDYRPIMYYYALDQKAGAQRALGMYMEANAGFFQFFTHTKNRKENAYTSMRVTQDLDFEALLAQAKSSRERNDLYLLLGFRDFNNPLASLNKIVAESPNAIQANVLMARAINQLERKFLQIRLYCPYYRSGACLIGSDHRMPLSLSPEANAFLKQSLQAALDQVNNPEVEDADFWKLSAAYLHFMNKDFDRAEELLALIESTDTDYRQHVARLAMLIDIAKPARITPELEARWVNQYPSAFKLDSISSYDNSTNAFIIDLLANRYYLQGDRVKAFLLQNNIDALESNPDLKLLDGIEALYKKKDPSAFEQILVENIPPKFYNYAGTEQVKISQGHFDFSSYAANIRGSVALSNAEFELAAAQFKQVDPKFKLYRYQNDFDAAKGVYLIRPRDYEKGEFNGYDYIPAAVFGSNRIECFTCPVQQVMDTTLLSNFSFITPYMNKRELANALVELESIGNSQNKLAPAANLLISNFLFNTTTLGYFRQVLTFNLSNGNDAKYRASYNRDYQNKVQFYYKEYQFEPYFEDNFSLTLRYAEKALSQNPDRELGARILFAASKGEQGLFFQKQNESDFEAILQQQAGKSLSYTELRQQAALYKTTYYRSYFAKLKDYPDTKYYHQIRSNCLFFDYYITYF